MVELIFHAFAPITEKHSKPAYRSKEDQRHTELTPTQLYQLASSQYINEHVISVSHCGSVVVVLQ
jgi:hypothetical protein